MMKTYCLAIVAIAAGAVLLAESAEAQSCPAKFPQCEGLNIPLGQITIPCVNPSIKPVTDPEYYREPMPYFGWIAKPAINSCIMPYFLPTYTGNGYDEWSEYVVTDTNNGPKLYKWKNYLEPKHSAYAPIMIPPPNAENTVFIPEK